MQTVIDVCCQLIMSECQKNALPFTIDEGGKMNPYNKYGNPSVSCYVITQKPDHQF